MANAIYPKWKQDIMAAVALAGLTGNTVKVCLVDADNYAYNVAHQYLNDIPVPARVAISQALSTKSVADGVFSAGNAAFIGVSGPEAEALVIFVDTGVEATSRLVAYLDSGYTNLPVTPVGGNVEVIWDTGPNKIFKL